MKGPCSCRDPHTLAACSSPMCPCLPLHMPVLLGWLSRDVTRDQCLSSSYSDKASGLAQLSGPHVNGCYGLHPPWAVLMCLFVSLLTNLYTQQWGSNSKPQDQELHAPPTEPARCLYLPCVLSLVHWLFKSALSDCHILLNLLNFFQLVISNSILLWSENILVMILSFKFIEVCVMAYSKIHPGECFFCTWEKCVLCCFTYSFT